MRGCLLAASVLLACCANSESESDVRSADVAAAADGGMPACERNDPVISVDPAQSDAVVAGTPVTYALTIHNADAPSCPASMFAGSVSPSLAGLPFHVEPESVSAPALQGGESITLPVQITSHAEEEAGVYRLRFFVRSPFGDHARTAMTEATYNVREPEGCHVAVARELLIRDPSVVDDPVRTSAADGGGAWTFGALMRRIAARPEDAARMVEALFRSYTEDQTINGFRVPARPNMQTSVLDPWPRTDGGALDLTRAPLRLLAIAPRLDLGEGRFVFGVLAPNGSALLFTLILEYALPGPIEDWQHAVHALQAQPFPGEDYNRALQALTDRWSDTLLRVRSNENSLGRDGRWEMRELDFSTDRHAFVPSGLALTPDRSWNDQAPLARFINDNRARILAETHDVPAQLDGQPFEAGNVVNELAPWGGSGVDDPEARRLFSLNTCDGCHGGESGTSFFHVFPRAAGEQSALSGFLTGDLVRDPITGEQRTYNELSRRRQLLERAVCH